MINQSWQQVPDQMPSRTTNNISDKENLKNDSIVAGLLIRYNIQHFKISTTFKKQKRRESLTASPSPD
jgi:hypothetical protein